MASLIIYNWSFDQLSNEANNGNFVTRRVAPVLGFEGAFLTQMAGFKGKTHVILVTVPLASYTPVSCSHALCVSSNPLFLVPLSTQSGYAELRQSKGLNV